MRRGINTIEYVWTRFQVPGRLARPTYTQPGRTTKLQPRHSRTHDNRAQHLARRVHAWTARSCIDRQRSTMTSANDATARAIGGSNCDAKHGAQRPARRNDHRREGFNFDTSVACRSCETALTLWQQSTCRVSKPRRGARAARVGRPCRGGHADPSRSSGLVSSRHPCACTFDSTIITRIAARVSKPCGVGALLAPHARPLPVAHPPSRCISLRWRRQAWKGARTLSAPEPHAPHDWMSLQQMSR